MRSDPDVDLLKAGFERFFEGLEELTVLGLVRDVDEEARQVVLKFHAAVFADAFDGLFFGGHHAETFAKFFEGFVQELFRHGRAVVEFQRDENFVAAMGAHALVNKDELAVRFGINRGETPSGQRVAALRFRCRFAIGIERLPRDKTALGPAGILRPREKNFALGICGDDGMFAFGFACRAEGLVGLRSRRKINLRSRFPCGQALGE